jgi:hypothetical protein
MIPARPPALVSWENSSANNAYVFTSPAPLSGNRSALRTNTLAASDARFDITVTVHKTSHQAEAANPRQRISPNPVRLRPAGFGLTAFVRFAGSSWHGLAQPELAKRASLSVRIIRKIRNSPMNPPLPFRAQSLHGENRVGFGEPKPADYEIELLLKLKAGDRVTLLGNRGARTATRLGAFDVAQSRKRPPSTPSHSHWGVRKIRRNS